jgi:hypothetical protein
LRDFSIQLCALHKGKKTYNFWGAAGCRLNVCVCRFLPFSLVEFCL